MELKPCNHIVARNRLQAWARIPSNLRVALLLDAHQQWGEACDNMFPPAPCMQSLEFPGRYIKGLFQATLPGHLFVPSPAMMDRGAIAHEFALRAALDAVPYRVSS